MIEAGLIALIKADPTLSTLIASRLYLLNLPETPAMPAVTMRLVSTKEDYTLDGPLGLVQVRLQIDSYAAMYSDAKAVSTALRSLLNGYSGTLPNGCEVFDISRDGEQSGFDEYVELPYIQTDWLVLFSE